MQEIRNVIAVELLEAVDEETSILKVSFQEGDSAYAFILHSVAVRFIGHEVIVGFREEIVYGKQEKVINTLTERTVVATLDKETEIKLYADSLPDIGSNVNFKDFEDTGSYQNSVVYCDSVWKGSSAKATWVSLRILDKKRNVAELKVFNPENADIGAYAKKYILCDLVKNKYGFNTGRVDIKSEIGISANPEITLAQQYIMNVVSETDLPLSNMLKDSDMLNVVAGYSPIDMTVETGFLLVQMAMEISLARDFKNLSKEVDVDFLIRLIVASKLYVYTHSEDHPLSKELQCITKLMSYKTIATRRLMSALESEPSKKQLEREIFEHISRAAFSVLASTKGTGLILANNKFWSKRD